MLRVILFIISFYTTWLNFTHNYINLISNKIWYLKNNILNNDLKYLWNEIKVLTEKMNRYSSIEIEKIWNIWKHKIIFFIFWKPIQRFFGFWIIHKQFLRWIKWIILCFIISNYQFLIYAKLYEKYFINKSYEKII